MSAYGLRFLGIWVWSEEVVLRREALDKGRHGGVGRRRRWCEGVGYGRGREKGLLVRGIEGCCWCCFKD